MLQWWNNRKCEGQFCFDTGFRFQLCSRLIIQNVIELFVYIIDLCAKMIIKLVGYINLMARLIYLADGDEQIMAHQKCI